MVNKKSTWGGARPNTGGKRPGAGRKFKIAKLRDGDSVRVIENENVVIKIARVDRTTGDVTLESPTIKNSAA